MLKFLPLAFETWVYLLVGCWNLYILKFSISQGRHKIQTHSRQLSCSNTYTQTEELQLNLSNEWKEVQTQLRANIPHSSEQTHSEDCWKRRVIRGSHLSPGLTRAKWGECDAVWCRGMPCDAVWLSVMPCDAVWLSVLSCDTVWCRVIQCVVVWCRVLCAKACGRFNRVYSLFIYYSSLRYSWQFGLHLLVLFIRTK